MRLTTLSDFFDNTLDIETFKKTISEEVEAYNEKLKTKGSSVSIKVDEDTSLTFTEGNLIQLCSCFINGNLNERELAYISDVLSLSESVKYSNEHLADYIEQMTDPEINGHFTIDNAVSIRDKFLKL